MKQIIIIITILTSIFLYPESCFSQNESTEKFSQGVNYYTSGDYYNALETWLDLYKTGYRSGELEYNIGNAFFKLNNIPSALLFYERAYLKKPADDDIIYNLQIARTLIVDRFEDIPELFFVRWYNYLALTNSSNNWARISIITFVLFLTTLSLYLFSSKYRLKVSGFWLSLLLIVISATSLALTFSSRSLVYNNKNAIIFSPAVNGKSSPDLSGTDLFVLHEGTKVTVEDKVGEWYEIRLSDGNKGWIPSNSCEII